MRSFNGNRLAAAFAQILEAAFGEIEVFELVEAMENRLPRIKALGAAGAPRELGEAGFDIDRKRCLNLLQPRSASEARARSATSATAPTGASADAPFAFAPLSSDSFRKVLFSPEFIDIANPCGNSDCVLFIMPSVSRACRGVRSRGALAPR
jgi:hypothetical protein